MEKQYFIVIDGSHAGPFTKEILRSRGITPATLVWCQGMPDWQKAGRIAELADLFPDTLPPEIPEPHAAPESVEYYGMIRNMRVGPMSIESLIAQGITPDTPVWRDGMTDWAPASTQPEIMEALKQRQAQQYGADQQNHKPGINNPYYGQNSHQQYNAYENQPTYGNNTSGNIRTNWMPWAIVATVFGLGSCIGLILGVIAIVQASNANNFFASGRDIEGESANRNAKTLTIIALAIDALAILGSIGTFFTSPSTFINII